MPKAPVYRNSRMRDSIMPHRMWPMEVIIRWGPPEADKVSSIIESHDLYQICRAPTGKIWNYNYEEVVLFEDFNPHKTRLKMRVLLQIMDRYPYRIRCFATTKQFVSFEEDLLHFDYQPRGVVSWKADGTRKIFQTRDINRACGIITSPL